MSLARDRNICSIITLVWTLLMVCGCAYIVFWRGASGWWWVLAIILVSMFRCRAVDDSSPRRQRK